MEYQSSVKGRISSFESMGGRDGPGLRFVVFMQGCPLRCNYCHNPETWNPSLGSPYSVEEVMNKILRYIPYFGKNGGVTVSGGEPLLQQEFVTQLLTRCKSYQIHTVLDTSGCRIEEFTPALLAACDLVLLDIKFTTQEDYLLYTGGSLHLTLNFLNLCHRLNKEVIIRHVVIPGLNNNLDDINRLAEICSQYPCVHSIELLPFSNLCIEKYHQIGIPFPLADTPQLGDEELRHIQYSLDKYRIDLNPKKTGDAEL